MIALDTNILARYPLNDDPKQCRAAAAILRRREATIRPVPGGTMPHIDQYLSVTGAQSRLLGLVRDLKARQEIVAITRDGEPSAVLLSMEQFAGLIETIEILSDQKAMRSFRRSLKQAEAGRWVSDERVFAREDA